MGFISPSTVAITGAVLAATFSMANLAYDASMINQLLLSEAFFEHFELDSNYIGLNIAVVNIGNVVAGPFTGPLMDKIGRRRALWLGNFIGIIAVIIEAAAVNESMLLVGRAFLGFGLTICAVAGPTIIVESTPGHLHGVLTNTAVLSLPIFGTIIAAGGIGVLQSTSDWGWRSAIIGELAAPILSSLFLFLTPESPRWLASKDRTDEARAVLELMHHPDQPNREAVIDREFEEMVQTINFERGADQSVKALIAKPSDRRRFIIVVLMNIFYQICGANTLPYFFTLILQSGGITDVYTTLYLNIGLCIWGTLGAGFGIWYCQRLGTKKVLLINTTIIIICLSLLAILTGLGPENGRDIGATVVVFIFWFAASSSWLILAYSYPPEIMRYSLRAKGTALGQAIGYAFCIMMTYTMPTALEEIEWRFYAANAGWDVAILILIWWLFVDTKDKTIEEIDELFEGVHFNIDEERDVKVIEGVEEKTPQAIVADKSSSKGSEEH